MRPPANQWASNGRLRAQYVDSCRLYDSRSPEKTRVPRSHLQDADSHGTTSSGGKAPEALVINGASRIPWYPGACYQSLMTNVKTPLMKFDTFEYPEHTVFC